MQNKNATKFMPWLRDPDAITVEIMSVCNLQCRHCYLYNCSGLRKKMMEYEMFEQIVSRLASFIKTASTFALSTVEGLMHPRIFDMLRLIRSYNETIYIYINTNGMLITEEKVRRLMECGVARIQVSLDGATRETVEAFKTGVVFEKVIEGIKTVKRVAGNSISVGINFVPHRHNIIEILDHVELCRELGVNEIYVSGLMAHNHEFVSLQLHSEQGNDAADMLLQEAARRAQQYGISMCYHPTRMKYDGFDCVAKTNMYVDENANIVGCYILARPTSLTQFNESVVTTPLIFGNLLKEDPVAIWQSACCSFFRKQFFYGALPTNCRHCPMAYGVIC